MLDPLGLVPAANQGRIMGLDHDQIADAQERDRAGTVAEDDVFARVQRGQLAVGGVLVLVLRQITRDREPAPHIIPVEPSFQHQDPGGVLHDGVVDGNFRQVRKLLVQQRGEILRAAHLRDKVGQRRDLPAQFAEHSG